MEEIIESYCCELAWKDARSAAWQNRDFSLCKCDHNESCEHCFPDDFKDGGKWDKCKPASRKG